MNRFRMTAVTLGLLGAFVAPSLRADESNKETHMTINAPLQVQDTLLAPGQYVFKLTTPDNSRSLVSIYNAETDQLEAVILGWEAYRTDPGDKQLFTINQPQVNQPAKLQKWFYPGDNFGVEFSVTNRTGVSAHLKPNQHGQSAAAAGDASSTRD